MRSIPRPSAGSPGYIVAAFMGTVIWWAADIFDRRGATADPLGTIAAASSTFSCFYVFDPRPCGPLLRPGIARARRPA